MRIAYIAPYQGAELIKRRPIGRNLSLGGNLKIELISELLQRNSHTVEILSQGEVIDRRFKVYPGFCDPQPFCAKTPIYYSSALPVMFLNGLWSSLSTLRMLKARHRVAPFDAVLIYNLKPAQVACANYARRRMGLPVVLEYEDNAFVSDGADGPGRRSRVTSRFYVAGAKRLLNVLSGCVAVSPYLLAQTPQSIPKFLLRGVVSHHIANGSRPLNGARKSWVVFSGTLEWSQGLTELLKGWRTLALPDWELHIAGQGPMTAALKQMAAGDRSIVFHGLLGREENACLLCQSKIGMNPQNVSEVPGSVFALKIIEYLAAGLHVITTPRGVLEPELETAVTYIDKNTPEAIATALKNVISARSYERIAPDAAIATYGPEAVSYGLNRLMEEAKALTP
jgi:glycosyltransferase involved in cell wall biosynthesis